MSAARDDVFQNIRRSLGVTGHEAPRRQVAEDRLDRAPKGLIPARGQLDRDGRIALFRAQAEAVQATVTEVAGAAEVPAEIARYLRDSNLPATVRMGDDARLAAMPWGSTTLDVAKGRSEATDLNAVSHALAGVAESGTLVIASGPDNPTTLNFLPDNHIVVVRADDVAGDYEKVWRQLRTTYGKGEMPRTVNLITGPSRSGDIAHTLLLGAHGPRNLHIVIVQDSQ